MLNLFQGIKIYLHFLVLIWHWSLKSYLLEGKDMFFFCSEYSGCCRLGPCLNKKTVFPGMVISIVKISWSWDHLSLYANPGILGGVRSKFTIIIHYWISPLCQFAHARKLKECDVTMLVPHIGVMSQIDVTMPSQKRPSLAKLIRWAIDDCFRGFVCSISSSAMIFMSGEVTSENHCRITSWVTKNWFSQ